MFVLVSPLANVVCALFILMCSQLAAICHVAFSSVVMGPVGPPNMGKEHDISAWLFSWLNLRVESTTRTESLCRCALWDHACESNKYVHLRFLAISLPGCMFHIKLNDSHTGRTAALKSDLTHDDLVFLWGRRENVFRDDMDAHCDNTDLQLQPRAHSPQLISSVWRTEGQESDKQCGEQGSVCAFRSPSHLHVLTACEYSAYSQHQTELSFVDSVKMVIL